MAEEKTAPAPQRVPSVTVANTISMMIIIGFFAFVFLPPSWWKIEDNRFNIIWPQLISLVSAVIGYQLGSSKQAERQTELLAKPSDPPPGTVVTTTVTPATNGTRRVWPEDERLKDMEKRLAALPPGLEADKLRIDVEAQRQKAAVERGGT